MSVLAARAPAQALCVRVLRQLSDLEAVNRTGSGVLLDADRPALPELLGSRLPRGARGHADARASRSGPKMAWGVPPRSGRDQPERPARRGELCKDLAGSVSAPCSMSSGSISASVRCASKRCFASTPRTASCSLEARTTPGWLRWDGVTASTTLAASPGTISATSAYCPRRPCDCARALDAGAFRREAQPPRDRPHNPAPKSRRADRRR